MKKQVLSGKMIGGEGWTADHVKAFLGDKQFYGIPSSCVEKTGTPTVESCTIMVTTQASPTLLIQPIPVLVSGT